MSNKITRHIYKRDKQLKQRDSKREQCKMYWSNNLWEMRQGINCETLQHSFFFILQIENLKKEWSIWSIILNKITWKLQTRFDWVCSWGIMKKGNIPHALSTCLSDIRFQYLKVESMIPKDQKIETSCYDVQKSGKKWSFETLIPKLHYRLD
jgi:hypothetical protein